MSEEIKKEIKKWDVEYDHKDGRKGRVEVTTEVHRSGAFDYGNNRGGVLTIMQPKGVDSLEQAYDLRYCRGDLHMAMIDEFFGKGLIRADLRVTEKYKGEDR